VAQGVGPEFTPQYHKKKIIIVSKPCSLGHDEKACSLEIQLIVTL
jgi:hypothetical protein